MSNVSEEEDRGGRQGGARYVRLYHHCVFMKAEYSKEGEGKKKKPCFQGPVDLSPSMTPPPREKENFAAE